MKAPKTPALFAFALLASACNNETGSNAQGLLDQISTQTECGTSPGGGKLYCYQCGVHPAGGRSSVSQAFVSDANNQVKFTVQGGKDWMTWAEAAVADNTADTSWPRGFNNPDTICTYQVATSQTRPTQGGQTPMQSSPVQSTQTMPSQNTQTRPTQTTPTQNTPPQNTQTAPVQTRPPQNTTQNNPPQTRPVQTDPVQHMPVQTGGSQMPTQTMPIQTMPTQTMPTQNTPVTNSAAQNRPVQNIQSRPVQGGQQARPTQYGQQTRPVQTGQQVRPTQNVPPPTPDTLTIRITTAGATPLKNFHDLNASKTKTSDACWIPAGSELRVTMFAFDGKAFTNHMVVQLAADVSGQRGGCLRKAGEIQNLYLPHVILNAAQKAECRRIYGNRGECQ